MRWRAWSRSRTFDKSALTPSFFRNGIYVDGLDHPGPMVRRLPLEGADSNFSSKKAARPGSVKMAKTM